ncbi:UNKNOWN [Stylonychia lemnae]|uniref:EamA domain-containing protein n=1 Tax=Stylonychia lemnae TaxID=5949 RepID=A0A078AJL4_STYLE|nr:UNKNOWN [Stylonychia lemnae]|eukprot:CDW80993.1 UNKNOWN [Stylonychia lemnae]
MLETQQSLNENINVPLLRKISIRYTNAYLKWTFMACFFFGTSNFLTGHLSAKLGVEGGYPFFIGNLFSWMMYHLYIGIENYKTFDSFWNKETSTYYDVHTDKFRFSYLLGPILRGIVQVAVFFSVFITMEFAFKAGVNQGIIASLFSTSIIMSAVIFYFLYEEKLSQRHLFGLALMITAVVLISIGKPASQKSTTLTPSEQLALEETQAYYLTLSIIFAIVCGIILTINGLVMRHYVKYMHISALQLNNDGGLIQMTVLMVLFILRVKEKGMYEMGDLFESIGASLLSMCANVTLSQAFAVGLGGPVQGINNLMSLVQTILAAIFLSQIPTLLQNFGLAFGLVGALVMCGVDKIFWFRD